METNLSTTSRKLRGMGRQFLLRLLAVALIAAACTLATTVPADAQRQRPNQNTITSTTQAAKPVAPTTQTSPQRPTRPSPPPAPAPAPVAARDDRAQLQPDAQQFVAATALPAQAEFAHLFRSDLRHLFTTTPTYVEPVVVADHEQAPAAGQALDPVLPAADLERSVHVHHQRWIRWPQ